MPKGLSNSELISKAAITSGSFTGAVGLSATEADRFIDYVIDQSVLLKSARVERMNNATKKIDKLGIGDRVLKPAIAVTDPGETVGISVNQIMLRAQEMIAVARISDDTLEDNIEGDDFIDHLMRMIAAKVSNDLEIAYTFGNKRESAVEIDDLFDGWLKLARAGHILDATQDQDRYLSIPKLSKAFKTLPNKYKINAAAMRYIASPNLIQDYVDLLGARPTIGGDAALRGMAPLQFGDTPFAKMGLMPENLPCPTGIKTVLSADSAAGDQNFKVDSVDGLAIGGRIALGNQDSASYEVLTISAVGTVGAGGTGVSTAEKAAYVHQAADEVNLVDEDATPLLFTQALNLIVGIHRDIRVETQRWARLRATDFVLTLRSDVQLENPDAVVVYDYLKVR